MTGGYASVNGVRLYYEIHGDGQPLLLLHGAMGTIQSCFAGLLPKLAATHEVIAVEMQGHGHTPDGARPLSYEYMAEDIIALARWLDIDRADFVGYSLGGAVGLQVAMTYPDVVRRLVYYGGTAYGPAGLYPEMQAEFEAAPSDALTGSVWHQAYRDVAPDPSAWPELVAKVNALDRSFDGWPAEAVRAVEVPTLLIIGDADIVQPEHTVEMFRLLGGGVVGDLVGLPSAQLAILPGTSHTGLVDRADWLHPMIEAFVS